MDACRVIMWCCLNGFCGQAMSHHIVLSMRGSEDAHGLIVLSVERSCGCVSSLHVVLCGWVLWTGTVSSHRALHERFCGWALPLSSRLVWMGSVDSHGFIILCCLDAFCGCAQRHRVLTDRLCECAALLRLVHWNVLWIRIASSCRAV